MASKEEIQSYLSELRIIDSHLKEFSAQIESLDQQGVELAYIQQSIDDLSENDAGCRILVPLSNGIFAKAKLEDKEGLLVNVGANVIVKKTFDETKAMMADQIDEIQKMRKTLEATIRKLVDKVKEIDKKMSEV